MTVMKSYLGASVQVELSGKMVLEGTLTDVGSDILVLLSGSQFIYVPLVHIQNLSLSQTSETVPVDVPDFPIDHATDEISYRKTLLNAKGLFVELRITPTQSLHGYLTGIMNDYFVFTSPVFRTVYVSLNHLKYLIPYPLHSIPYSLSPEQFSAPSAGIALARSFDQQLKKLEGRFVVFDLGESPNKIGLFRGMHGRMIELITADGNSFYWNPDHLKTVHLPSV